jgi:hypothetical protein
MVAYTEKTRIEDQPIYGTRVPPRGAEESASMQEERDRLMAAGKSTAMEQKTVLARSMDRVARALHRTARNLDEQQDRATARYFDIAADKIGDLSSNLEKRDLETLLSDSQNFARKHPAMVFGGAVAAGLVLSRLMTSSAARRQQRAGISRQGGAFQAETKVESMGVSEAEKRQSRPYGAVEPGDYASKTK